MSQVDVIARTHHIKVPDGGTGTAFTLDIEGRQYIITAKHLVQKSISPIHIFLQNRWQLLQVGLVGHCIGETDISVLYTDQNLPKKALPEGSNLGIETDLKLAEGILFYGFPHGLSTSLGDDKPPVALVKRGVVSGFFGAPAGSLQELSFLIDGHNNPGFSGGPVVTIRNGEYKVAGVISGYRAGYQEVYGADQSGNIDKSEIVGYVAENTGIIVAHNIQSALDLVADSPVGLPVSENSRARPPSEAT